MFDIKYNISILPNSPGVYIMKDNKSEVIYVGKAKNLKKRVSQYFQNSQNHSEKTTNLVKSIAEFEYIVTQSEVEALILENNLIKNFNPKYNILLKDDKTYPFIKITLNEDFPRIFSTKNYVKDGNIYFGPFTLSSAVNEIIKLLRNIFPVRNCKLYIKDGIKTCKPCMYYQIKKCNAPCYGLVSKKEYRNMINQIIEILSGKNKKSFIKSLEDKMFFYSDNLDYEKALLVRDKISNIRFIFEKQKIFLGNYESEDYINIFRDNKSACVQVFFLRNGKILGRDHFIFEEISFELDEIIIEQFIKRFYGGTAQIPNIIYSPYFSDKKDIEEWISIKAGKKVSFKTPKKGDKKRILNLVETNAKIMLSKFNIKNSLYEGFNTEYLKKLSYILGLNLNLDRIEAYDISNISGFDSVGSMVVFNKGVPQSTEYRRFKIKNVQGCNDYESIKEVVFRRFNHAIREINDLKDGKLKYIDGKFCIFPDLIFVDGGKGHVNIVEGLLREMDIKIPVCGIVKNSKHKTRGLIYNNKEIKDLNNEVMNFITRVQDEMHRYAISYHRTIRNKRGLGSILNEIPNIGNKRRRELLLHFKDINSIKKASFDQLMEISSMDRKSSNSLIEFFKK